VNGIQKASRSAGDGAGVSSAFMTMSFRWYPKASTAAPLNDKENQQ
jgi:hypothetical protein